MCIDTRDCTHSCIRRIILIYLPGIHLNNTQFNSKGNKEIQGACCQNVRSIEDSAELAAQDDCSHSSGVEQKKATRYHAAEMFGITERKRAYCYVHAFEIRALRLPHRQLSYCALWCLLPQLGLCRLIYTAMTPRKQILWAETHYQQAPHALTSHLTLMLEFRTESAPLCFEDG